MPWKTTQTMELRNEFVLKALQTTNFRELCREYGISAKTGYKWKQRFLAHGLAGLGEESRRPDSHPASLDEQTVCKMVKLKTAHPHWGPRKIRALYQRQHKGAGVPSESSFKRVLERSGLTAKRIMRPVREAPVRISSGPQSASIQRHLDRRFQRLVEGSRGTAGRAPHHSR